MSRSAATDPATKERALQLARQHGAAEAARQTGIKAATIRSWRRRVGDAGPPSGADPTEWASAMRRDAEQAAEAGRRALKKAEKLIDESQAHKAKEMAMAAGILIDKANHLEARALTVENRNVQVAEFQGKILVEVLDRALRAIGLPARKQGSALSSLLRELILVTKSAGGSIAEGDPAQGKVVFGDLEHAATAKQEVRATLRQELEAEIRADLTHEIRAEVIAELQDAAQEAQEAEQRRRDETPQLPAPDPDAEVDDDTEEPTWAGPVRRIQTVPPSDDVVEGTAVEETASRPFPSLAGGRARGRFARI